MSYAMQALGYDLVIDTPVGAQTISFDIDKVGADLAQTVTTHAWPLLETKARAALPSFVDQGVAHAAPQLQEQGEQLARKLTTRGLWLVVALGVTLGAVSWYQKRPPGKPLWGSP